MHVYFWRQVKRELLRIRREFKEHWKNYFSQTFLASVIVFIVLLLLEMEDAVIIASIGATAFVVFAMPRNVTAKPKRIIGGYVIGLIVGSVCAIVPQPFMLISIIVYSTAVGASIFFMITFDVEHPPASGIALGTAITGISPRIAVAVITSSLILSLAHSFTKKYLKDLT